MGHAHNHSGHDNQYVPYLPSPGFEFLKLTAFTASGQSIFGFFCRVGGTFLAMVSSLAIWYIPDQKTPGIIVFLWLFIFVEYYFIKFPRLAAPIIITVTTQLVIVGYELQVRTLGEAVATRSGQPYYP